MQLLIKKRIELLAMGMTRLLDIEPYQWESDQDGKYYRLRVWDYRIIYKKYKDKFLLLLLKLDTRWDVYK